LSAFILLTSVSLLEMWVIRSSLRTCDAEACLIIINFIVLLHAIYKNYKEKIMAIYNMHRRTIDGTPTRLEATTVMNREA
jgi:hypothetical protein